MAAAKLFDPRSDKPFVLSRSKVELFIDCPRCFYLDRGLGWLVYCNGRRDLPEFGQRLEFTIRLLSHDGGDGWVEGTLRAIRETHSAPQAPPSCAECEYCDYVARAGYLPGSE